MQMGQYMMPGMSGPGQPQQGPPGQRPGPGQQQMMMGMGGPPGQPGQMGQQVQPGQPGSSGGMGIANGSNGMNNLNIHSMQQQQMQQQQQHLLQIQMQQQQQQQQRIQQQQQQQHQQQQQQPQSQQSQQQAPPPQQQQPPQQQSKPPPKKKGRPTAAAQALARQTPNMAPPLPSDFYRQNAMAPPPPPMSQPHLPQGPPQTAMPGIASHMPQIEGFVSGGLIVEPWADGLDEIDHRELAMGRFRARQEILSEIFGPERLKDIPPPPSDAWAGLGMEGETLEMKVASLEKENAALELEASKSLDEFRHRLKEIDEGRS